MQNSTIGDHGPIVIECLVEAGAWGALAGLQADAEKAVAAAVAVLNPAAVRAGELSLVFTDDAAISELNAAWRGMSSPTNVLSFPATGGTGNERLLGDIVLAHETVAREAALENKPFDHHLTHLIVHGFLHLFGYDHQTEDEALEMEALERRILQRLSIPDPYGQLQAANDL